MRLQESGITGCAQGEGHARLKYVCGGCGEACAYESEEHEEGGRFKMHTHK